MSDADKRKNQGALWVAIVAILFIILLIVWLTYADLWGDAGVAAFIS